jgi:hypothetical protein
MTNADDINMTRGAMWSLELCAGQLFRRVSRGGAQLQGHEPTASIDWSWQLRLQDTRMISDLNYACHVIKVIFNYIYIYFIDIHNLY